MGENVLISDDFVCISWISNFDSELVQMQVKVFQHIYLRTCWLELCMVFVWERSAHQNYLYLRTYEKINSTFLIWLDTYTYCIYTLEWADTNAAARNPDGMIDYYTNHSMSRFATEKPWSFRSFPPDKQRDTRPH